MRQATLLRLLGLLLLAVAIGVTLFLVPVKDLLTPFLEWVRSLGPWAPVAVALAYIPASLVFFPGSLLSLGAGFVLGLVKATIAVSLGSTAGAAAAFLVGRTLLRGWVEARVARNPKFRAIDQAVAEQGLKIVLLTRLSPVFPFTLLNYAFGLTRVRFRDYVLASWIGMFPGTVTYVYLGSLLDELADVAAGKAGKSMEQKILFGVGLAATLVVTVFVTRLARRALAQAVPAIAGDSTRGKIDEPTSSSAAGRRS
jgi:uncharacterized membrane protein YdjX (TVP38/TMEM64 family)